MAKKGSTYKQLRREEQRKKQMQTRILWIVVTSIALAGIGYVLWSAFRPSIGEAATIMADTGHVPEGEDPGPFNTNPPTSGKHYAGELDAGFYDENELVSYGEYPDGYLVHNLEHGYVIFWYNCDLLDDSDCEALKGQLKNVIDAENEFKVIAFPRASIDHVVVATSWGKFHEFENFEPERAREFIRRNRNKAPEPNAP